MPLLSLSYARRLSSVLRPVRALAAGGWLLEADVDAWLSRLHPALRLNRVFAKVRALEWVSDDLLAVTLRCNGNAKHWRAGQYVPLYVEIDGVRHTRSYSLTRVEKNGIVELGIRRQAGGRLSNYLLDNLTVGSVIELGQAQGDLVWPSEGQGVGLLAAGSGITALIGLLRDALAKGYNAPVQLLHYVRESGQRAYAKELEGLMAKYPNFSVRWALTGSEAQDAELSGRLQADHLSNLQGFSLLACGAGGFIETLRSHWQGPLQSEAFSPLQKAAAEQAEVKLSFTRSTVESVGDNQRSILEQAEAAGLRPFHGCRQGVCTLCTCTLVSGAVRDLRSGDEFAEPGQAIRICVSAPVGDVQVDI